MKLLLVTDAWQPQVNGVVRTLSTMRRELQSRGHAVEVISPDRFRTIPCPSYPQIRLALLPGARLEQMADEAVPVHCIRAWAIREHCVGDGDLEFLRLEFSNRPGRAGQGRHEARESKDRPDFSHHYQSPHAAVTVIDSIVLRM